MAAYSEIVIEQGASFTSNVTVEDTGGSAINLTSYIAESQMRKSYYTSSYYTITADVSEPGAGTITLSMTSANTANVTPGRYVYDLKITAPDQTVTRVVEGIVTVLPAVTK